MKFKIFAIVVILLMVFMVLPGNKPVVFAEAVANTGEVKGVVINRADNSPFDNKLLSLFPVTEENGEMVMTFTNDHDSYTDDNGHLSFKDVPPGTYVLHCNLTIGFSDEHGNTMLIKVQGGDVVDLGEIMIDKQ